MTTINSAQKRWPQAAIYDQKLDQRVAKHVHLRVRNNATTCRSPSRQCDIDWRKSELQQRRDLELLKRRKIDRSVVMPLTDGAAGDQPKVVLRPHMRRAAPLDRRSLIMEQDLGITWPDVKSMQPATWVQPIALHQRENQAGRQLAPNSGPWSFLFNAERVELEGRGRLRREREIQRDEGGWNSSRHARRDASAQTESGFVTIKESPVTRYGVQEDLFVIQPVTTYGVQEDLFVIQPVTTYGVQDLLQLADYLQEALWREETLKQKLAILQHGSSTLLHSQDKLWTTRCNEDLMTSKIVALESQLQACAQKLSQDGMQKLRLQMEEQKLSYEEKALGAIQRAIGDKMEAEKKAASLEESLQAVRAELARWQDLYCDLKENCVQLRRSQELCTDQLNQLQSQLETAEGQEAELRNQLRTLQSEGAELCSKIDLLEEENQTKREQLQEMREKLCRYEDSSQTGRLFQNPRNEMSHFMAPLCVSEGTPTSKLRSRLDTSPGDQFHDVQQRLTIKEKECVELRAELEAVEHECHSCQLRLSQCREELRLLSARRSEMPWCSWLGLFLLMVTITMGVLGLLWVYPSPCDEQLRQVCRGVKQWIRNYLQEVAMPKHAMCHRPV